MRTSELARFEHCWPADRFKVIVTRFELTERKTKLVNGNAHWLMIIRRKKNRERRRDWVDTQQANEISENDLSRIGQTIERAKEEQRTGKEKVGDDKNKKRKLRAHVFDSWKKTKRTRNRDESWVCIVKIDFKKKLSDFPGFTAKSNAQIDRSLWISLETKRNGTTMRTIRPPIRTDTKLKKKVTVTQQTDHDRTWNHFDWIKSKWNEKSAKTNECLKVRRSQNHVPNTLRRKSAFWVRWLRKSSRQRYSPVSLACRSHRRNWGRVGPVDRVDVVKAVVEASRVRAREWFDWWRAEWTGTCRASTE